MEQYVRSMVTKSLEASGWTLSGPQQDVFQEEAKHAHEKRALGGKRPDFVLYSATQKPLAIIECKGPKNQRNLERALDQGEFYARALGAPCILATDGVSFVTKHIPTGSPLRRNDEDFDDFVSPKIMQQYAFSPTIEDRTEPERMAQAELIQVFRKANDSLRKVGIRAGIERFTEFSNILFLKLFCEKREQEKTGFSQALSWDYMSTLGVDMLLPHVNRLVLQEFNDYKILPQELQIKDPQVFYDIFHELKPLKLWSIDSDVKGNAFEYFLRNTTSTQNDLGEYFTPRHIVRTLVSLADIQLGERVYDPFCGTGGILVEAYRQMLKKSLSVDGWSKNRVADHLYGTEISDSARIAKMNMILAGDGHTNIRQVDSLAPQNLEYVRGQYDVVISNIPYSQKTDHSSAYPVPTKLGDSICVQHAIQSIRKTREGGKLVLIVPEGFLYRKDLVRTREYLFSQCHLNHVVSLPKGVFLPYTGVKTNIIHCTRVQQETKVPQKTVWLFPVANDGYSLTARRQALPGRHDLELFLSRRDTDSEDKKMLGFQGLAMEDVKSNGYRLSSAFYTQTEFKSPHPLISLGDITTQQSTRNDEEVYPVSSVTMSRGLIPWEKRFRYSVASKDITKYKVVEPGWFVYCQARLNIGSIARNTTKHAVCVSPSYITFSIDTTRVDPDYMYYLVKSQTLRTIFETRSVGSVRNSFVYEQFAQVQIPLPPLEEQRQIGRRLAALDEHLKNTQDELTTLWDASFCFLTPNSL